MTPGRGKGAEGSRCPLGREREQRGHDCLPEEARERRGHGDSRKRKEEEHDAPQKKTQAPTALDPPPSNQRFERQE